MSYISYLLFHLNEKKENLIRLRNAHSSINSLQSEFLQYKPKIKTPELSSSTWHGESARRFVEAREDMDFSYKDIAHSQMDTAVTMIEDKVTTIQAEINSLETSIANERERMERENQREGRA
ncbi:YwqH-like family protein [Bacillus salacetis]|uniref:YwqH-like family protein n=1 Tax=Bacillus salacetis TaxID=2315464 RepID=UPI00144424A6|nr:DUF5082 family protein [Bacillus salacetis]